MGKRKPNGYWNDFDRCKEEALKYDTISEFHKGCSGAYKSAKRNGWLDKVCSHITIITNGYWNDFDKCHKEALKFDNKSDFQKGMGAVYNSAKRNMWLNDICSHMIQKQKPPNFWNYQNCKEEALKYNNKTDFKQKSGGAYYHAL